MKAIPIVLFATIAIFLACNKDKFETKPTLEIKSLSTEVVPRNSDLRVTLQVTDKEGDVDSSLFVIRQRLNAIRPDTTVLTYRIPQYPDKSKVDMEINLSYAFALTLNLPPTGPQNQPNPDTLSLKFVAKDKAGNLSDTVSRQVIVLRR